MLPHAMPESGAASRKPIDHADDFTSAAGMMNRPSAKPAAINPLVTRDVLAPRRMSAPAPQPPSASAAANTRKGSAPNRATCGRVTCRTSTRYDGSQDTTKYQKKSQQKKPIEIPTTARS